MDRVDDALSEGGFPIVMGGDHSLALGSAAGAAAFAERQGRPCSCCGWMRIPISTRR
jgi:arginase